MDEDQTPPDENQTPPQENHTQSGEERSNRAPRLIILGVAGLVLACATGGWYWYDSTKVKEPDIDSAPVAQRRTGPKIAGKVPLAVNGAPAGGTNVAAGLNSAKADGNGAPAGGTNVVAGLNGAKAGGNGAPAGGMNVVAGLNGAKGVGSGAAVGTSVIAGLNGAKGTVNGAAGVNGAIPNLKSPATAAAVPGLNGKPAAAMPLVVGQLRPGAPTSVIAAGATPGGAVKPAIAGLPNQNPHVPLTVATMAKPGPAANAVNKPAAPPNKLAANPAANKPNGAPLPPLLSKPPVTGATNPAAPAAAGQAAPTAAGQAAAATAPKGGKIGVDATSDDAAAKEARVNVGRTDPMQPLTAYLPFPHNKKYAAKSAEDGLVTPPPPDADAAADTPGSAGAAGKAKKSLSKSEKMEKLIPEKLVPPPPPTTDPLPAGGLPIDQLPVPPAKPTIGDKMQVLGILDDKVILTFPRTLSIKNKWPRTLTLATGQEFESIKVVSINKDGVTIEEDGERTLKPLPTIK